jgi:hypothetical protein
MGISSHGTAYRRSVLENNFPSVAFSALDPGQLLSHLYLPVSGQVLITGDTSPANIDWLRAHHGVGVRIIGCSPRIVLAAIEYRFRDVFRHRAVADLVDNEPQFSASTVITHSQIAAFAALFAFALFMLCVAPRILGIVLAVVFGVLFVANVAFRAVLLWVGADDPQTPELPVVEQELPIYSILVPLYREANVMPALLRALRALDYPRDRLDIKLIVEADDRDTAIVADAIATRDPCFSVIRVPPDSPRTKPRACNYAMPFALGEFTVIFDAEDRPEPDQLRKAVAAFRAAPANIACLQARLNFYNANENWLTRGLMAQTPPGVLSEPLGGGGRAM